MSEINYYLAKNLNVSEEQILKIAKDQIPSSFLQDESKLRVGDPKAVYFPTTTEEVSSICQFLYQNDQEMAVSGTRSGIVGGSVPNKDASIISIEKLKRKYLLTKREEEHYLTISANITLNEISTFLNDNLFTHFYPVDPTYYDACIGGNISTNAGGSRSVFYGQTRNWIDAITVVTPEGKIIKLNRGEQKVEQHSFVMQNSSSDENVEKRFIGCDIKVPQTKNSLGPRFHNEMDLIDMFIGAEGILGVITEVTIRLTKKPAKRWFHMQLFEDEQKAFNFAKLLLEQLKKSPHGDLLALEFIDKNSLKIALNSANARQLNLVKDKHCGVVFFDFSLNVSRESDVTDDFLDSITEILTSQDCDLESSISGDDEKVLVNFKTLRHAVPEQINAKVALLKNSIPSLHKISTDMSVPTSRLQDIFDFYRKTLTKEKFEFFIFGHFGSGHLHLNIIPDSEEKLTYFKENLYSNFAKKVVELGGSVSGEHGIGRLKRWCMEIQFNAEELECMHSLKSFFDPKWLMNRGVIMERRDP